jgi:predicted ester cyclase
MTETEKINEFAQAYASAWCSQEPERVAAFFSDTGWLSINGGPPSVGRSAIAEAARGFMTAFPDMVVSFDALVVTDTGPEFHWTLTGTNTGPGGTGNRVRITGYELWRIGPDGMIAESKGHFDVDEYQRQLQPGP